MSSDELLQKFFEADMADKKDKVSKQREWLKALERASEQTGLGTAQLERIVVANYRKYQLSRLSKELPHLPKDARSK
jgi:hypothetical protein